MSRSQRDKGYRGEREAVETLTRLGWKAVRVPLSGAAQGFAGDVLVEDRAGRSVRIEVKRRNRLAAYLREGCPVTGWSDAVQARVVTAPLDLHVNWPGGWVKCYEMNNVGLAKYLRDNYAVLAREDHGPWLLTIRVDDLDSWMEMRHDRP